MYHFSKPAFILKPKFVFYFILVANLIMLFLHDYLPTIDGPQHLYISRLIIEIIKGNEDIKAFYQLNDVWVGNSLGQYLLAFFNILLPAKWAEKLLFISYFVFLPLAFRYLIRILRKEENWLTLLIFPFSHTMLLYFGYYNFSLAGIFYFLILAIWIKHEQKFGLKVYFSLIFLFILLFFSHILVLGFLGITLGLYLVFNAIIEIDTLGIKKSLFSLMNNSIKLLIVSLPSLLLTYIYYTSVTGISNTVKNTVPLRSAVIKLIELRSLIAFDQVSEGPILLIISIVVFGLFIIGVYNTFDRFETKRFYKGLFKKEQLWLWLAIVFIISYLLMPNKLGVGAFKTRINVFLFYVLLIWLNTIDLPNRLKKISLLIVIIAMSFHIKSKNKIFDRSAIYVNGIVKLEDLIPANATLYSINLSNSYTQVHYASYLGINKAIISLNPPQLNGAFPVIWRNRVRPIVSLEPSPTTNKKNSNENQKSSVFQPGYVFIWAGTEKNMKNWRFDNPAQYNALISNYVEIAKTVKGSGLLFKRKD
jgi:hypothetical protein